MQNVMQGEGCSNNQPTNLGVLRREILAVLIGNPLFSSQEQLLANHQVHETEDPQRLALWLRNVRCQAAQREQEERLRALEERDRLLNARIAYLRGERSYPLCDAATLDAELQSLLKCASLPDTDRRAIRQVLKVPNMNKRLLVDSAYTALLERTGYMGKCNPALN